MGGPPYIDPDPTIGSAAEFARMFDQGAIGHSFKIPNKEQAVRVLRRVTTPLGQRGIWFEVEDLAIGYVFKCALASLGDELNEMEVIAWSSRS